MSEPEHVRLARDVLRDSPPPKDDDEIVRELARAVLDGHARIAELEGQLKVSMLRPVHPPFANVQTAYEAYAEMRADRDRMGKRNVQLEAALTEALERWERADRAATDVVGLGEMPVPPRIAELRKLLDG